MGHPQVVADQLPPLNGYLGTVSRELRQNGGEYRVNQEVTLSLRALLLRDEYRRDRHQLVQDFYIPCLEQASLYCRAVGFFSSTSMAAVASPCLSPEDAQVITQGALVYFSIFSHTGDLNH